MATAKTEPSLSEGSVSGLILLDKPVGKSSFFALGAVKRLLGTRKVGHAGTLDPFANGLLIVLVGKLTKTASLFTNLDKEYLATFRFGEETDTLDSEGDVVARAPIPELSSIMSAMDGFRGEVRQTAPAFSAVKIDGKRAYARARNGESFTIPERIVHITEFELLSWNAPELRVRIACSKGTYIRSIARDLAIASGSRAHCSALTRTRIGDFALSDAIKPENLTEGCLVEPASALSSFGISAQAVDDQLVGKIRNGVPFDRLGISPDRSEGFILITDSSGKEIALLENDDGVQRYRIVFGSP